MACEIINLIFQNYLIHNPKILKIYNATLYYITYNSINSCYLLIYILFINLLGYGIFPPNYHVGGE